MGADRRMVYITGCQHLIKAPPPKKNLQNGVAMRVLIHQEFLLSHLIYILLLIMGYS